MDRSQAEERRIAALEQLVLRLFYVVGVSDRETARLLASVTKQADREWMASHRHHAPHDTPPQRLRYPEDWVPLQARVASLSEDLRRVQEELERAAAESRRAQATLAAMSADLNNERAITAVGLDASEVQLTRYLPVAVYTNSDDEEFFSALEESLVEYLDAFGFALSDEFPIERGSFFRRIISRTQDQETQADMRRRAALAEHGLLQHTIGRDQAAINMGQAEAAERVHRMLQGNGDHIIQIGSLVGIGYTDQHGRRHERLVELTPDELLVMYKDRRVLRDPATFLSTLADLRPTCEPDEGVDHEAIRPQELDLPHVAEWRPSVSDPRELPPGNSV